MEERIKELFAIHKTDFYDANGMKTEVLTISRFEKAMAQMEQRCYIEEANNEMLIQELHSKDEEINRLKKQFESNETFCREQGKIIRELKREIRGY